MSKINSALKKIINAALKEDKALNDITSDLLIPKNHEISFAINSRQNIILCGVDAINLCFEILKKSEKFTNAKLNFEIFYKDGDCVEAGKSIVQGQGNAKLIFAAERVILNLIQHLSGVSTFTNQFASLLKDSKTKILDTRKTIPGLRVLEKYAVKTGGGKNHRLNLSDMILIKDNHIAAAGSISQAILLAKNSKKKIEIECDNLEQVKEAVSLKPNIIMLDNMNREQIIEAQKIINSNCLIEISGGINLDNIKNFVDLNVDFISIGALTHSAKAVDIGLDINYKKNS